MSLKLDGGCLAWTVVASSFMVNFLWGGFRFCTMSHLNTINVQSIERTLRLPVNDRESKGIEGTLSFSRKVPLFLSLRYLHIIL